MRTLHYVFFTAISFLLLSSCSSEQTFIEDQVESETDVLNIAAIYEAASSQGADINAKAMGIVDGGHSRATTKDDILGYLLTVSIEQIDSLCTALDVENIDKLDDFAFNARLDSLMEIYPAEDIAQLCHFMDDYIASSGHSIQVVEQGVLKIQTPKVQELAISSAAIYDNITSDDTANSLVVNSDASRSCIYQLAFDCGGIAIGVASTALSFAQQDYVFAILDCVKDVVEIVKAVRKYKLCERLNAWR